MIKSYKKTLLLLAYCMLALQLTPFLQATTDVEKPWTFKIETKPTSIWDISYDGTLLAKVDKGDDSNKQKRWNDSDNDTSPDNSNSDIEENTIQDKIDLFKINIDDKVKEKSITLLPNIGEIKSLGFTQEKKLMLKSTTDNGDTLFTTYTIPELESEELKITPEKNHIIIKKDEYSSYDKKFREDVIEDNNYYQHNLQKLQPLFSTYFSNSLLKLKPAISTDGNYLAYEEEEKLEIKKVTNNTEDDYTFSFNLNYLPYSVSFYNKDQLLIGGDKTLDVYSLPEKEIIKTFPLTIDPDKILCHPELPLIQLIGVIRGDKVTNLYKLNTTQSTCELKFIKTVDRANFKRLQWIDNGYVIRYLDGFDFCELKKENKLPIPIDPNSSPVIPTPPGSDKSTTPIPPEPNNNPPNSDKSILESRIILGVIGVGIIGVGAKVLHTYQQKRKQNNEAHSK